MRKSFEEEIGIKGHLTIHKVENGQEELVFDDKNVVVSGFGWALAYLYGGVGSTTITDFQVDRFQLGVSGQRELQVSTTSELSGALSASEEYRGSTNVDSNLYTVSANQYLGDLGTSPERTFAKIPFSKVTKIYSRSVRYTIFVDEDSCNGLERDGEDANLNEIGLFIKNPTGATSKDLSVLGAYRYFSNIRKTSDFGLVFRWTISFG